MLLELCGDAIINFSVRLMSTLKQGGFMLSGILSLQNSGGFTIRNLLIP